MNNHIACPGCGSLRFTILNGYEEHYLNKCRYCHLIFALPVPDYRDLEAHYDQYSRDDYLSPITVSRYKEILGSFEKNAKTKKILDLGCGVGFFLNVAKEQGWDVYGTEISDKAIEICQSIGIKVFKGAVENIDFQSEQFDVITSFEVVEHLTHPDEYVRKIHDILKPGGILYITTPNFNSLNRRLLKSKWNVICFPEHLMYFTKTSLHSLLVQQGFERIKMTSEGVSPSRLITSLNRESVNHSSSETKDEKLRTAIEGKTLLKKIKLLANAILNKFSLGESLKATYRRV